MRFFARCFASVWQIESDEAYYDAVAVLSISPDETKLTIQR